MLASKLASDEQTETTFKLTACMAVLRQQRLCVTCCSGHYVTFETRLQWLFSAVWLYHQHFLIHSILHFKKILWIFSPFSIIKWEIQGKSVLISLEEEACCYEILNTLRHIYTVFWVRSHLTYHCNIAIHHIVIENIRAFLDGKLKLKPCKSANWNRVRVQ